MRDRSADDDGSQNAGRADEAEFGARWRGRARFRRAVHAIDRAADSGTTGVLLGGAVHCQCGRNPQARAGCVDSVGRAELGVRRGRTEVRFRGAWAGLARFGNLLWDALDYAHPGWKSGEGGAAGIRERVAESGEWRRGIGAIRGSAEFFSNLEQPW